MNKNNLHVYAQTDWHSEAYIVGTRLALQDLRDAIDRALSEDQGGIATSFVNDGEGFDTVVLRVDNEAEFAKLAVPYTSDIAKERNENAPGPWDKKILNKLHRDRRRHDHFDLGGEG